MKIHEPQNIGSDEALIKELVLLLEMALANLPSDSTFEKAFGRRLDHAFDIAHGKRQST